MEENPFNFLSSSDAVLNGDYGGEAHENAELNLLDSQLDNSLTTTTASTLIESVGPPPQWNQPYAQYDLPPAQFYHQQQHHYHQHHQYHYPQQQQYHYPQQQQYHYPSQQQQYYNPQQQFYPSQPQFYPPTPTWNNNTTTPRSFPPPSSTYTPTAAAANNNNDNNYQAPPSYQNLEPSTPTTTRNQHLNRDLPEDHFVDPALGMMSTIYDITRQGPASTSYPDLAQDIPNTVVPFGDGFLDFSGLVKSALNKPVSLAELEKTIKKPKPLPEYDMGEPVLLDFVDCTEKVPLLQVEYPDSKIRFKAKRGKGIYKWASAPPPPTVHPPNFIFTMPLVKEGYVYLIFLVHNAATGTDAAGYSSSIICLTNMIAKAAITGQVVFWELARVLVAISHEIDKVYFKHKSRGTVNQHNDQINASSAQTQQVSDLPQVLQDYLNTQALECFREFSKHPHILREVLLQRWLLQGCPRPMFGKSSPDRLKCFHCFIVFKSPEELRVHMYELFGLDKLGPLLSQTRIKRVIEKYQVDETVAKAVVTTRKRKGISQEEKVAAKVVVIEELLTCKECGKQFKCNKKLQHHQLVHSEEKKFVCDYKDCTSAFKRKHDLDKHQLVHSDARPFVCNDCGKQFKLQGNLRRHELVHSDARPFVCNHEGCSMTCKSKYDLNLHQLVHSDARPFVCNHPRCTYASKYKSDLTRHQRVHSRETGN